MRVLLFCLLTGLPFAAHSATPLADLQTDGERAVYCYAANTLHMQLQGVLMADATQAAQMMRTAQRWQNVVNAQMRDPVGQRNAMQNATMSLSQRMQGAGGNPQKMLDDVITPTMATCNALLDRLDPPEPATAAPAAATPTTESVSSEPYDTDVFAGLLSAPLTGKLRWNRHSTVYADTKTSGTFSRNRASSDTFQLTFDSKITTLCVGELTESHRSADGYMMHLAVTPGTGEHCEPRVTRGLLFPFALDDQRRYRQLMLRLYDDQGRLVTATRFRSKAVENKHLDLEKLLATRDIAQQLEADNDDARRGKKLANLQNNPDFARLEPFYNSCMGQAESIRNVMQTNDYCVCMTYKFGVGGRIPESEFASYTQDFSRLLDRLALYNDDNKVYTRLAETCQSCSSPNGSLHPGCVEMDNHLLMPNNFAEMIDRLDQPAVRIETSTFYKENFFVIYLQGYSDYCSDEIENPVPFDYVVTEYTTDPYAGTYSNEVQRDRTYVARQHAKRYEDIYDKHSQLSPGQFTSAIRQMVIRSDADLRRNQSDLAATVSRETEKRVAVRKHLAQGCQSAPVQRVYRNLDALFE